MRADDNPDAFKVRRGKTGGFRDHLSADDVAWIDECEAERLIALRSDGIVTDRVDLFSPTEPAPPAA